MQKLLSTDGPDEWDEMRRSDDQIIMLLRVVKNPIMSARWFISPADDSKESKKISKFVSHVLMDDMGIEENPKTFEKFKREALTAVEFGYSLFEITNKIVLDDEEYRSYVGFKGIDWRSPKTIEEWDIEPGGKLTRVRQIDNSQRSRDVFIDGDFVLHIAPEMEGDNYEGISMLRPIYGNWLRKNVLLKLQMIGIERAATGVPIGEVPRGQENSTSQAAMEDSLSRFVSHEQQYMTVPEGFKVDSLKIEHDAEKVQAAISAENVGMSKSFLVSFMELGLSGSGSFALGTDLSDIFLSGLSVYANSIRSPINTKLIPQIVKLNFGKQRKYPELIIEGINDKAGKELSEILKTLKEGGFLQEITDRMQEVIHQRYDLPYDSDIKVSHFGNIADEALNAKKNKVRLSETCYNLSEKNLSKKIETVGQEMTELMKKRLFQRASKLVSAMIRIWRNEPKSKRREKINRLLVPDKGNYKKTISDILEVVYVDATDGVRKELSGDGLKLSEQPDISGLPAESKSTARSQAELIVGSQDSDLRKNLFFSFTAKADILPTEEQMKANLLKVVDSYVSGPSVRSSGYNAVSTAVNLARNAVFQKKEVLDKIESFVFMNPSPTAKVCVHLTGRVFTREEYVVSGNLPPLHHNCNSWIRAQLSGSPRNKPLDPRGLTIQGTSQEIESINKSVRF